MPQRIPRAAAMLLCAGALFAQHSTTRSNPFDTPADREEGSRLFRAQCAACHGPGGAGGAAGPDLTGELKRGHSDEALFVIIGKGIPGTTMPAFAASPREIMQVTAYVRSLSVGKGAAKAKGDKQRGAALFESSGCRKCHAVGPDGGSLGPELTTIGSRRSLSSLRESIVDPGRDVSQDYWRLRARTKSGKQIEGIRLNEDTFSFQYRDAQGLKAIAKSDLAEAELLRTTVMPSFAGKLSTAEVEDLVAFLASLQEKQ